jgi:hypothetical protein
MVFHVDVDFFFGRDATLPDLRVVVPVEALLAGASFSAGSEALFWSESPVTVSLAIGSAFDWSGDDSWVVPEEGLGWLCAESMLVVIL